MKLRKFLSTDKVYAQVEGEITAWVEKSYPGLSIEFYPHLEIVQTDPKRKFTKGRVLRITEAVNIKIGDIMESHAEKIYIAERLDRIYVNHPDFDIDVESMADIKKNKQFLDYLLELVIKE